MTHAATRNRAGNYSYRGYSIDKMDARHWNIFRACGHCYGDVCSFKDAKAYIDSIIEDAKRFEK